MILNAFLVVIVSHGVQEGETKVKCVVYIFPSGAGNISFEASSL